LFLEERVIKRSQKNRESARKIIELVGVGKTQMQSILHKEASLLPCKVE